MSENIEIYVDEDDVLLYYILGAKSFYGRFYHKIQVEPERFAQWIRLFEQFDDMQMEIRDLINAQKETKHEHSE